MDKKTDPKYQEIISKIPPNILPNQKAVEDSQLEAYFVKHYDYMRKVDACDTKLDVVLFKDEDHTSGTNIFSNSKSYGKEKKVNEEEEEEETSCCFNLILCIM